MYKLHSFALDAVPEPNAVKLDPANFEFKITDDADVQLIARDTGQLILTINLFGLPAPTIH